MDKFPFELSVKDESSKLTEAVVCTGILRLVQSVRAVYDGRWNGRAVIVKVFMDKFRAGRHVKREWGGLVKLKQLGLNCPEPLFFGETPKGHRAIVVEKITGAVEAVDVFRKAEDKRGKLDLLTAVCRELARHNEKGAMQKDMHLGNFMIKEDAVFMLDPAQIRFYRRRLDRIGSIRQLAMLARYLHYSDDEGIEELCREYFSIRGWTLGAEDRESVRKEIARFDKKTAKQTKKKSLRTGKRNCRIVTDRHIAVFMKSLCSSDEFTGLMDGIDNLMNTGEILKDGNTCFVSRFTWQGVDLVVKRYNHKGGGHSVRHTIKGSRARRSWLNAHHLEVLKISTPKPLAYIEQRKEIFVWCSYIITEFVDGVKLHDFLRDENVAEMDKQKIVAEVTALIERLDEYGITHGDMKHSNILVTDEGPVLTDLDAMVVHTFSFRHSARRKKDMQRLGHRWEGK